MALTATDTGGDFELPPAGNHPARCCQIIDLGTQYSKYYDSHSHKVLVCWELMCEPNQDGVRHMVWKRYTLSLSSKATLRQHLDAWRGRPFTEEELKGFDVCKVLGQPCLLQVVHKPEGDKTYANVQAVAQPPSGIDIPPLQSEAFEFTLTDPFDRDRFDTFREKLQDTIKASPEYQRLVGEAPPARTALDAVREAEAQQQTLQTISDEVPF